MVQQAQQWILPASINVNMKDGSEELAEGMAKFDKEGIHKITDTLEDTGIKDKLSRLQAVADAAGIDNFYGGKAAGMTGESRIIFKTGTVKES